MAETTRLKDWAELLFDTGKRSNLISFRDTKTSTIEILTDRPDDLFKILLHGKRPLEVFDPEIEKEDEEEGSYDPFLSRRLSKEEYRSRYTPRLMNRHQILPYSQNGRPIRALQQIRRRTRTFIEETGVNVAHMAFGFIRWNEAEHPAVWYLAPLLLIPIRLERVSAGRPFRIASTGDDVVVNPNFSYLLRAKKIFLPEYSEHESETLSDYLAKVSQLVAGLGWTILAECRISTFSFLKINMFADLKTNEDLIIANTNVRRLLNEKDDQEETGPAEEKTKTGPIKAGDPLLDLHNVVDADSSQIEAIEMAKAGRSFVLQGPPGTGKSQTITNIIAECLHDGRKVLFVSEKLAALNVVYENLRKADLAEFCLELHSHKANKKDFIDELCRTLSTKPYRRRKSGLEEVTAQKDRRRKLDAYVQALHKPRPVIDRSLHELFEDYAKLRRAADLNWLVPNLKNKGAEHLRNAESDLRKYDDYVASIGHDYRRNAWYGFQDIVPDRAAIQALQADLAATKQIHERIAALDQELKERYGLVCRDEEQGSALARLLPLFLRPSLLTAPLLADPDAKALLLRLSSLSTLSGKIKKMRAAIEKDCEKDVYALPADSYRTLLIRKYSSWPVRLFSRQYHAIRSSLKICLKKKQRFFYDDALRLLRQLSALQQDLAAFNEEEKLIKHELGPLYQGIDSDWETILRQSAIIKAFLATGLSFKKPLSCPLAPEARTAAEECLRQLNALLEPAVTMTLSRTAGHFDPAIIDMHHGDDMTVIAKCTACLGALDRLTNWCSFLGLFARLKEDDVLGFLAAAIDEGIPADALADVYRKLFLHSWIETIMQEETVLSLFPRVEHDQTVRDFQLGDRRLFLLNKRAIKEKLARKRPSVDHVASGGAVSNILHEGKKMRRKKSIRTLMKEAGRTIQTIKPCFLMSPLSVSTYLDPKEIHFDLVIFDEASQIFPQDAIGAIYRADQMIVVGDSKQMPPSNFFNASIEMDEGDESQTEDVTAYESILDIASSSFASLSLNWHYRSRDEHLIAFSNRHFYDDRLVTFPAAIAEHGEGYGVSYRYVSGIFDRKNRTNRKEAEEVVDLIFEHIRQYPKRSLGVVAFSIAQENLIENILARRRRGLSDEEDAFFAHDRRERFFVKNLETVQGDERDTIIFSTSYGMGSDGRRLNNFGPLNRAGGERRLNVAITRAKFEVKVVSSMHAEDIDLSTTTSRGAELLKEYLAYAEDGDVTLTRTMAIEEDEEETRECEKEIAEFLRANGYVTAEAVGCSDFRIDLGLMIPESSRYFLAIECDGTTYRNAKNARDRDRLREQILKRMGWRFYRIWSTDWFRNRKIEEERLLERARETLLAAENALLTVEQAASEQKDDVTQDAEGPKMIAGSEKIDIAEPYETADEETVPEKEMEETEDEEDEDADIMRPEDGSYHLEMISSVDFPSYIRADVTALIRHDRFRQPYPELVRSILEVEAPLAEELLLQRTLGWFTDRRKIDPLIESQYQREMRQIWAYGITRDSGFLYLDDGRPIRFRKGDRYSRRIKHIAPEELADGMFAIIKANNQLHKETLYQEIVRLCGIRTVSAMTRGILDDVLRTLRNRNLINTDDDYVFLK